MKSKRNWQQIMDLISDLRYEPYIDDQIQIEEIWNIVEALLKRGGFEEEPWEVKEHIRRSMRMTTMIIMAYMTRCVIWRTLFVPAKKKI